MKSTVKEIEICLFNFPVDYASVLTGHGVPGSATGRFYFRKKTLQYSFLIGENLGWPEELTFMDKEDNILEDFTLSKTSLQNQTDKLCGAWERLPRKYRRLLKSEELTIRHALTRDENGSVGTICKENNTPLYGTMCRKKAHRISNQIRLTSGLPTMY